MLVPKMCHKIHTGELKCLQVYKNAPQKTVNENAGKHSKPHHDMHDGEFKC